MGRLIEQLVKAGLLTEAQARERATDDPLVPSCRVVQELVDDGLDERELAGFFVSLGFGPMLQAQELARADEALVRRLPGSDAHELCALPLRPSPAGAVVAMADPTDERAVERLCEALGGPILPTVARLSDLLASIERAYPQDRPTLVTDPMALVRKRAGEGLATDLEAQAGIGIEPGFSAFDPTLRNLASTASPVWDRAWNRSATEREVSRPAKGEETWASARPASTRHSWVRTDSVRLPAPSDSAMVAHLAKLARATSRDEVVRIACQGCLLAARAAAFLALRKGVFRGWDGVGEDVTSAGIRSLWVPASNPSILNEVLHSGHVFRGAHGQTAADHLLRAAFGNQGREIAIVPVLIGSRLSGVLCANDPAADTTAVERIAEAMGKAFERLIASKKSST
jgi:GAF domain-containing protein